MSNELTTINNELFEIKKEFANYHEYEKIKGYIKSNINNIFNNYLEIGGRLRKIKDNNLFLLQDYKNIYEFAANEFELSETTVKNLININFRFCNNSVDGEYVYYLGEKYKDFSYSQLVELLSVPEEQSLVYLPTMSVKEIRDMKKIEAKIEKNIKEFIRKCVDIFYGIDPVYLKKFKYQVNTKTIDEFDLKKAGSSFWLKFFLGNTSLEFYFCDGSEKIFSSFYCYIFGHYKNLAINNSKINDIYWFKKVCEAFVFKMKKENTAEVFENKKKGKTKAEKLAEKEQEKKEFEDRIIEENKYFNISEEVYCFDELEKINEKIHLYANFLDSKKTFCFGDKFRAYSENGELILRSVQNNSYAVKFNEEPFPYLLKKDGSKIELNLAFLLSYFLDNVIDSSWNFDFIKFLEKYSEVII